MQTDTIKEEFKCNRCGCCCKNVSNIEETKYLDKGNGVCKYYDESNKSCLIYDFRPEICRVDKMYKRYKDKILQESNTTRIFVIDVRKNVVTYFNGSNLKLKREMDLN